MIYSEAICRALSSPPRTEGRKGKSRTTDVSFSSEGWPDLGTAERSHFQRWNRPTSTWKRWKTYSCSWRVVLPDEGVPASQIAIALHVYPADDRLYKQYQENPSWKWVPVTELTFSGDQIKKADQRMMPIIPDLPKEGLNTNAVFPTAKEVMKWYLPPSTWFRPAIWLVCIWCTILVSVMFGGTTY